MIAQLHPPRRRIHVIARVLLALVIIAWTLGLACLGGCATTLEWPCPERAVVRLEDTRTIVKCKSTNHSVTIVHPADAP